MEHIHFFVCVHEWSSNIYKKFKFNIEDEVI